MRPVHGLPAQAVTREHLKIEAGVAGRGAEVAAGHRPDLLGRLHAGLMDDLDPAEPVAERVERGVFVVGLQPLPSLRP